MIQKSTIIYPEDFPHQELRDVLEGIETAAALYQRRVEFANQLLQVRGNTQAAVARTLGVSVQSINQYAKRLKAAKADGAA